MVRFERTWSGKLSFAGCVASAFGRGQPLALCVEKTLDRPPAVAVAQQKPVGLFGSRTASGINRQVARSLLLPDVEDWLHHSPACLDRVGALEERCITDHNRRQAFR